jgi:hypothetical protein
MTSDRTPATAPVSETNKGLVRRLVEEVLNERRLDVIDELYHPRLASAARRWIEPFLASFSDVHMRIDESPPSGRSLNGSSRGANTSVSERRC